MHDLEVTRVPVPSLTICQVLESVHNLFHVHQDASRHDTIYDF